jgi:hypothetical protein
VARILVVEPHPDVRSLLEIVIRRIRCEPIAYDGVLVETPDIDAAVIEPGRGLGSAVAQRLHDCGVPLVLTSIYPPTAELLALEPVAYLVKPFPLYALERALGEALDWHRPRRSAWSTKDPPFLAARAGASARPNG